MDSATLTFAALNARIDALPEHESMTVAPTRRVTWGTVIGFGAGFAGLAVAKTLPGSMTTVVITSTLLAVEIVALAIAAIPRRPWRLPGFAAERRDYAEQLDFDRGHYDQLVTWLSEFPKEHLEAMAEYATHRHERLRDKYPLISGGLEKLGALPIVAALYLQFKDLRWPPHPTWPEFLIGLVLVSLYWVSLQLASVRFRVQLFGILLAQAAQRANASASLDAVA